MKLLDLRDTIWNYPYVLFVGRASLLGKFVEMYQGTRPFSYIFTTIVFAILTSVLVITQIQVVLGFNSNTFVEGTIVGTTPSGAPRGPSRLNPLQVSSPQLDKDIIELVYEPLIKVNQDGSIQTVLAEDTNIGEKNEDPKKQVYRFKLKKDIKWHDGTPFTAQDVKATFDLIKGFGEAGVPDIYASEEAKNINLEVMDDYVIEFSVDEVNIPYIAEVMTFKILPSHLIEQYRDAVVSGAYTGVEQLKTVGTGPFILSDINQTEVVLSANNDYHRGSPKLDTFKFKLLRDEEEALSAIRAGEIHGITNITGELASEVTDTPNIGIVNSNVIYNQYWAIYFNLVDSGPEALRNKNVRRAFSLGINREIALQNVYENAETTYGPIPKTSEVYSAENQQPKYNREKALKVLKDDGWELKNTEVGGKNEGIVEGEATKEAEGENQGMEDMESKNYQLQTKEGKVLQFSLSYVNNPDREKLVKSIKADLLEIGILLKLNPLEPNQLANIRREQKFELLLLGVNTFHDPDRYQFFHSSQIPSQLQSGLNISGYKSEKTRAEIDEEQKKAVRIPLVDKLLDDARKSTNPEERKEHYLEFQKEIASDIPAIFLYHPTIRYAMSKRVRNVKLDQINTIEDRFRGVENWEISYE